MENKTFDPAQDKPQCLADLNPEILKLPPYLQGEFNHRFMKEGTADYLALRAEDCIKIVEVERWRKAIREKRIAKREALSKAWKDYTNSQLLKWQKLYKEQFNIAIKIQDIQIPRKRKDFNWLIVVYKYLSLDEMFYKLRKNFPIESSIVDYNDGQSELYRIRTIAKRPNTSIYAVWVRDNIESDTKFRDSKLSTILEAGTNLITLEERLLLELFHYRATNKFLDIDSLTFCAGSQGYIPSRHRNITTVPHIHFNKYMWAEKLVIHVSLGNCSINNADGFCRPRSGTREVISL